jgi:hypothetical protein
MPTAKPTPGRLLPPLPLAMPDWPPVRTFGGYQPEAKIRFRAGLRLQHRLRYPRTCPCMDVECRPLGR